MTQEEICHIAFTIEQALGHKTHGKNLQEIVSNDPTIQAHWALPAWDVQGFSARLPLYNSNWTIRAGWRARRALARLQKEQALDALFFHTQVTAVLAPDWLRRFPSVVSLDATPLQYDRLGAYYDHDTGPRWMEQLKWRLNRDCFRAAGRLVTWSAWARQGLIDDYQVPAAKVTVIPPGVNVPAWTRPTPRTAHSGPLKILFVGGNLERKGGLLLLDVYRHLYQESLANGRTPPPELHLVTRDAIDPQPGVSVYNEMAPNSEALKRLYFQSDIFCLPTYGDALPMVLSEAGAAGLPLISTAVAAIPEIVEDGESGFLIPPGDGPALATALRTLLENPPLRLRQGESAAQAVRHEFDAEKNGQRLLALLKHIITHTRARG